MANKDKCPYLEQVHRALPRLLALFDTDPVSPTFGLGDRTFWAWKLKDFPNATQQGAVNGLARLVCADLLPDQISRASVLERIHQIILGSKAATERMGSLSEALPNEGSFCVTALVAADVLTALDLLEAEITPEKRQQALEVVAPWILFLHRQDEFHGIISNHLAVAVLALVLWEDLTGEDHQTRCKELMDRILAHRSPEGWFREYSGADPGYQSWMTSALAEVHRRRPAWSLGPALEQGCHFLSHFAHPDGSFGGIYASRMTRFCFPAGFEVLARDMPAAHRMAIFAREAIAQHSLVTLDTMDAHNLVPLFNDYAWAAAECAKHHIRPDPAPWPAKQSKTRIYFEQAGLLVDGSTTHYSIISTKKGGALVHFADGKLAYENAGTLCMKQGARPLTSQFVDDTATCHITETEVHITSALRPVQQQLPTAFRFIILRLLSLTAFRSVVLGNLIKRILAALLVTKLPKPHGTVVRHIKLGHALFVHDTPDAPSGYHCRNVPKFRAIHMASQGYWQLSDDAP